MISSEKLIFMDDLNYSNNLFEPDCVSNDENRFFLHPEDFCAVLFTGGPDISPELYGSDDERGLCGIIDTGRDARDILRFKHALNNGLKVFGICRGFQFISAMFGLKIVQHIEGHALGFNVPHVVRLWNDYRMQVNSTHHQAVLPSRTRNGCDVDIMAWAEAFNPIDERNIPIVEAAKFYKIDDSYMPIGFGVQWHPENVPIELNRCVTAFVHQVTGILPLMRR